MNAHIINCDENAFLSDFLPNGFVGVGLYIAGVNPQQLASACRASYSMYADMKTIRPGDVLFIHAGQYIYGAFQAESEFKEAPVDPLFMSNNIHYYPHATRPSSGWRNRVTAVPNLGYYRRLSICPLLDSEGNNVCFNQGIDSRDVFDLKERRRIRFIPERWKYTDTARTIRPIMEDEAKEILKLLHLKNSDDNSRRNLTPASLEDCAPIEFILNPNIVENEKIIEGWILQEIGKNPEVDKALGEFDCFGNNMPVGYLKFIDILGYQCLYGGYKKYKLIEVKKEAISFPNDVNQLLGYMDWIAENVADGEYRSVEGILIAREFDDDSISFVSNFNAMSRTMKLVKFDYHPPSYKSLRIQRII